MKRVAPSTASGDGAAVPAASPKKPAARKAARKPAPAAASPVVTADQRHQMIAAEAYYRAERRGFVGGSPLQDWLEAEAEVDRRLIAPPAGAKAVASKGKVEKQLEARLKEWDLGFEELMQRARDAEAGVLQELQAQFDLIRDKRTQAHETLQALRSRGEGAWEDLKDGLEQALADLRSTMESIAARFK